MVCSVHLLILNFFLQLVYLQIHFPMVFALQTISAYHPFCSLLEASNQPVPL